MEIDIRDIKFIKKMNKEFGEALLENIKKLENYVYDLLSRIPSEKFNAFYYSQIKQQLEDYIKVLEDSLQQEQINIFDKLRDHASQMLEKVNEKLGIEGFAPFITPEQLTTFSNISGEYIKNIPNAVKEEVEKQLRISALSGDTIFEIQKKLSGKLEGYKGVFKSEETRAKAIAMNEMARAYSYITWEEVKKLGEDLEGIAKVYKIWNCVIDERTRVSHKEANGQKVLWNEPFKVGGENLIYPLDPSGSPGNTINCRCFMTVEIIPLEEAQMGRGIAYQDNRKEIDWLVQQYMYANSDAADVETLRKRPDFYDVVSENINKVAKFKTIFEENTKLKINFEIVPPRKGVTGFYERLTNTISSCGIHNIRLNVIVHEATHLLEYKVKDERVASKLFEALEILKNEGKQINNILNGLLSSDKQDLEVLLGSTSIVADISMNKIGDKLVKDNIEYRLYGHAPEYNRKQDLIALDRKAPRGTLEALAEMIPLFYGTDFMKSPQTARALRVLKKILPKSFTAVNNLYNTIFNREFIFE